jgi:hypothetical protein
MTKSDVTQIKIGKHKVGFVGLKETFKEIEALYSKKLMMWSLKNY